MKRIFLLTALITCISFSSFSQFMETGMLPPPDGQPEVFTEWKKVEYVNGADTIKYDYRIAFIKRKALACSYEIQVKNNSSSKLELKLKSHYYDQLVKGNFGDEYKGTAKPGQELGFFVLTQGCKEDKEKEDQSDFDRCRGCGFSYEIYVVVD